VSYPVIPAIRKFEDAKKALENIRQWFKSLAEEAADGAKGSTISLLILSGIDLSSADLALNASSSFRYLKVVVGSGTHGILAPNVPGREYVVVNTDGVNSATIKVSGKTGVTIGANKRATVYCNGTDYERVTGDQ
jgi:hypothetical protein